MPERLKIIIGEYKKWNVIHRILTSSHYLGNKPEGNCRVLWNLNHGQYMVERQSI